MRNNQWLANRMQYILDKHFSDLVISNQLVIKFGRKAKTRLGSIRKILSNNFLSIFTNDFVSEILITGYFANEYVPVYVIDATIAHELCHYAHGFSSPLPQIANHPHRGGLVSKELNKRGMADTEHKQKKWIKKQWQNFIK